MIKVTWKTWQRHSVQGLGDLLLITVWKQLRETAWLANQKRGYRHVGNPYSLSALVLGSHAYPWIAYYQLKQDKRQVGISILKMTGGHQRLGSSEKGDWLSNIAWENWANQMRQFRTKNPGYETVVLAGTEFICGNKIVAISNVSSLVRNQLTGPSCSLCD